MPNTSEDKLEIDRDYHNIDILGLATSSTNIDVPLTSTNFSRSSAGNRLVAVVKVSNNRVFSPEPIWFVLILENSVLIPYVSP
jgi:hypothetical protein